jgi:hypothetical protein
VPAANVARLGFGIQTAKGTASTTPIYWINLTGGGIRPTPETAQRSETGLGRDVGSTYITVLSSSGDPSFLLRPKTAPLFYYATLGTKVVASYGTVWSSGQSYTLGQIIRPTTGGGLFEVTTAGTSGTTEPVWTGGAPIGSVINATAGTAVFTRRQLVTYDAKKHTLTAANDQPYLTVWKELGASLFEKHVDCKMTALNMEFSAGGDLACSSTIGGLDFLRLASSPGGGTHDQDTPLRVPGAKYTLGGTDDGSLATGNFNIEASQNQVQTNKIVYSYQEPGTRTITFGYTGVYEGVSRYAKTYYGSATGTTPSDTPFAESVVLQYGPNWGPYIKYTIQTALFQTATTEPDPGGAPMMLDVAGQADRPVSGEIVEVEVVNDVASYATS